VLGGRPPCVEDMPRLKYSEQVILESMRLFPPAFVIGREALAEFELGGYTFPAGTTVLMSPWVVHRDERFFDRPEEFEPQRWASEKAAALPKLAYFPFGAGPRICIGNTFAMMESILLLATIAQAWSFEPAADQKIGLSPVVTLRPRYGVKIVVSRRSGDRLGGGPEWRESSGAAKMTP
jgi:cytochrome P450